MPDARYGHCLVKIGPNQVMLAGGSPYTTSTYIGKIFEGQSDLSVKWYQQNDMNSPREGAACGLVQNSAGGKFVIVAGCITFSL